MWFMWLGDDDCGSCGCVMSTAVVNLPRKKDLGRFFDRCKTSAASA